MKRTNELDHVIWIHAFFAISTIYITVGRLIIRGLDDLQITMIIVIIGSLHFFSVFKLFLSNENFLIYKKLSIAISVVTAILLTTFIVYSYTNDESQISFTPSIIALIATIYSINLLVTNNARYLNDKQIQFDPI